jgi:hypothetical protein
MRRNIDSLLINLRLIGLHEIFLRNGIFNFRWEVEKISYGFEQTSEKSLIYFNKFSTYFQINTLYYFIEIIYNKLSNLSFYLKAFSDIFMVEFLISPIHFSF